jgi:hypothetical protein
VQAGKSETTGFCGLSGEKTFPVQNSTQIPQRLHHFSSMVMALAFFFPFGLMPTSFKRESRSQKVEFLSFYPEF